MKKIAVADESKCKGCGYCKLFCPKNAIQEADELNSKGFYSMVVDEEKCIGCSYCYIMCPDYVFEVKVCF